MKAVSHNFQFSPAVRAGSHIVVSGIIGVDTHLQSQLAEHYCIRSHAPCRVIKTSSLLSVD